MIRIRLMQPADLPLGMRLKAQNNWNQTEADWRRLLALQPDGCFVAEWNGDPVATTVVIVFGDIAWVAMVLVDASLRGRGLGTALMEHALAFLEERGVQRARLDATPLGRPIYEKLGFVAEYELARHEGTLPIQVPAPQRDPAIIVRPLPTKGEIPPAVFELDRCVMGTDRSDFLRRFFQDNAAEVRIAEHNGQIVGYSAGRPGARAAMMGPCLANAEAGPLLVADAARRHANQPVFIDIPMANAAATALAKSWGLTVQRHLLRMGRGESVRERIDWLWASSGPEKG